MEPSHRCFPWWVYEAGSGECGAVVEPGEACFRWRGGDLQLALVRLLFRVVVVVSGARGTMAELPCEVEGRWCLDSRVTN